MADERPLPWSLEAEQAVLGAVMLHESAWPRVAAVLTAEDFFRDAHQRTWRAMTRLAEAGTGQDLLLVKEALRATNELEEVGGPAYLSSLVDGLPVMQHVADYAAVVREKARLRAAIFAANSLAQNAYEAQQPATSVVDAGVTRLLAIAGAADADVRKVKDGVGDYLDALDRGDKGDAMMTGFSDLDDLLGGLQRGQLVVVAARTSVGKTSWALGVADNMAQDGTPAGFVSLEMSHYALAAQLLSWRSKVPAERLRRKQAQDHEYAKVGEAFAAFPDEPLWIVEGADTLTQVSAWARRLRDEHQIGCLVIDYLQRLTGRRAASREGEVAALSRGLQGLARDLNIVVIALAQLSRAPEMRRDKRPLLSDLRESGAIEMDADITLLLYRGDMHRKVKDEEEGVAECIVAKNRSGPTGVVKLYFHRSLAQFCDLSSRGQFDS